MRVLHIIHHLWMGGAQRLLSDILPIMKQSIDVSVLVTQNANSEFSHKIEENGINIISLNIKNIHNPLIAYKISSIVKDFDVVHVHLFPSLYLAAFGCMFSRVPMVYTEHSTYNKRRGKWYMRPIEKMVYNRYNRIISISDHTQNQLLNWIHPKSRDNRFVIVNNGVDLASLKCSRVVKERPDTLIMISRFAPSKDQATLIRAMRYLPTDIKLMLVGNGETFKQNKALASELGLEDQVLFLGKRSDIADLIAQADIGIQSSVWEGFGLTAVELMAGGVPVVASDVDGLKQVVEGAGVIFPRGDEMALAGIINQLIKDKSFYLDVKKRCEERAKLYDIHKMAEKYIEVYKSVIK